MAGTAETAATLAIAATHQSQLGQDFEIYASQEFGLVELADAHSRASALMPQKKNPYALAAIRTQAGQAAGDLAGFERVLDVGCGNGAFLTEAKAAGWWPTGAAASSRSCRCSRRWCCAACGASGS